MSESDLVSAMLRPETWPEGQRPDQVTMTETHISWVFFTGTYAYKILKPVNFGFLDFTSLEKRKRDCEYELDLNHRLSPSVYLRVAAVRKTGDRYTLGPEGDVVEYAVIMRQLPGDRWLSNLLETGEADPDMIRRIAARIAAFHAQAGSGQETVELGGLKAVHFNVSENFEQTLPFIDQSISRSTWDVIRTYTDTFLDAREDLFRERERAGRIRDGHGDLHAEHICVENGIDFIDCIEFNTRFRYGDVAADIAFLAMDLDHYGRHDLSDVLIDEYVRCTGDTGAWAMMPFYQCYRAFTRGKVASLRLSDPGLSASERPEFTRLAESYFNLAREYATLKGPLLIILCGYMGSGKSTLAGLLAPLLQAEILSSDSIRKEMAGLEPTDPCFEEWGRGLYSPQRTKALYREMLTQAAEKLAQPKTLILDASFEEKEWREKAQKAATDAGAEFFIVHTQVSADQLKDRLVQRHQGSPSISDGRVEILSSQIDAFDIPSDGPHLLTANTDDAQSPEETCRVLLKELYQRTL